MAKYVGKTNRKQKLKSDSLLYGKRKLKIVLYGQLDRADVQMAIFFYDGLDYDPHCDFFL